jgi:tetraprenyl-beta-curcumene synthase
LFDDIRWAVRHVLQSPARLRFLLYDGVSVPLDLTRFVRGIVPLAANELARIRRLAEAIPDGALRAQAIASIDGKAYHVAGAAILATFLPRAAARHYVEIVAPLETIYDYLDNLCDRHPDVPVEAYPVLHQAIADALNPEATPRNYYALGPQGDDGDYLRILVTRTQRALRRLAEHERLAPAFAEAAAFYAEMQTYKHYPAGERERACIAWFERHRSRFPDLTWYEFACAAGSQFQVYAPLYALFAARPGAIERAYDAYFPSVSALHVLLDSFIDQAEDHEHGELNFASLYASERELRDRVKFLASSAEERFATLSDADHHRFVLRVMMLFYLTHPKVYTQRLDREARALLQALE